MTATISSPADSGLSHKGYRAEIDGLRALAVIAVIINHFSKNLMPSGYLGVDIFFVISGYVITASFSDRRHHSLTDVFLGFYSRRIKRLVPALVLCVVITSILICLFDPDPHLSLLTGFTSLFGFSNLYLLKQATNYFAASTEMNAFTQTWSLGVEEQFYIVFPFFVWFTGFGRHSTMGQRNLLAVMAVLAALSLIAFVYLSETRQAAAYFLMPTRLWELGVGCLLFLGLKYSSGGLSGMLSKLPPLGIILAIVATFFAPLQFSVAATIAAVAFTALLIACVRPRTLAYDVLTARPVIYIGLISYSLYLWHWSVLSISRWTIGIHWWSAPLQIALMFLLADLSYRFVENPLRRAEWSTRRWKSIAYGLAAASACAGVLVGLEIPLKGKLYAGDRDVPAAIFGSPVLRSSWLAEGNEKSAAFSRQMDSCLMTPQYLAGDRYRPQPVINRVFLERCAHSSVPSSPPKILMIGDSFAGASASHVALAASKLGYDFKFVNGYGCPFPFRARFIKATTAIACRDVDGDYLEKEIVGSLRRGDLLVIRVDLPKTQYLSYPWFSLPPIDAYDEEILSLRNRVVKQGAQMLLIGANPTLSSKTFESGAGRQWFQIAGSDYFSSADTPQTLYFLAQDRHLRDRLPKFAGLFYFSTANYLCGPNDMCFLRRNGRQLYYDPDHISPYAHDLFFPALLHSLTRILRPAEGEDGPPRDAAAPGLVQK